jgi:hypothetical protein
LIVCLAFTACSQDNANINEDNENNQSIPDSGNIDEDIEPIAQSHYDILGERDFKGETFVILDAVHHPSLQINMPDPEGLTGDPINDALYNRDKLIEDKYNINIEYIQRVGQSPGCAALERSVAAGEHIYDMVVSPVLGNSLASISTRNVLYNMLDAPYLSLQSSWWSKLIYESMQFNNKLFYNAGDIFLPSYSKCAAVMIYNQRLMQDYGLQDNLYDLVFEGKWTLDVLDRLTREMNQDINLDGRMHADDDFFGLISQNNTVTMGFYLAGLGVNFSTVRDDNIYVDLASIDNLSKIDKLTQMLERVNYRDQNDIIHRTFKESRSLFLVHCMETPQMSLRDMEDDYGILPMPKWDENQETYVSFINAWGSGFVAIPLNADIEKSAFLMEAMAYAGYEMLRRPVYDITLKTKGTRDEESERIIDIILETGYLDLNSAYNFGETQEMLMSTIIDKRPFVSSYEEREPRIQREIDNFITSMSFEN